MQRLSEAEVTEHIEDQLGAAESSLSSTVFAKSEGVPFFMAELLRCWRTGLSTTPSELAVSGYALDIVRQRLRTLAPETLSVLSAAAVIGCTFDLVLLSSVTQQSLQALIERVDDARSFHILAQDPDGRECFRFTHNLIRRVLYDDLSTLGRAEWHRRVFEALSEREAARDADVSAGRAYHLLEATPCVDPARAIAVARQAAKRACESGAYAEACALLRRALRVADLRTPTDPSSTGHLLSELASCERAAGEPGFEQHFARAVELARAHGSSDVLYRLCKQILGAPGSISSAVAEALLVAALATLPADDHERRAVVLSHMASMTRGGRDNDRVKALLAQAQQHAQLAGASAQRAALSAQLYFAGSPGNSAVALPMMDELEQLAADSNPRTRALRLVQPLLARAMFLMQSGDLDAAERALEVYGSEVRVLQDAELVWYYERLKLSLRLNRGEFAHARQTIVQLKWQADRLELHGAGAIFAIDTIELDRLSNELRPLSTSSLRALRADPGDHITLQTAKLRTLAQAGEHGPARAGLHALPPEELMMLPKSRDYLAQLANIALASTAVGAQAHAQVLYTLLEPYADSFVASHSLHCYGVVSHTLGLLARTLGDHPKARHFFEHAIARQRSLALPLPLARSRFQLGALLLESRLAHEREAGRDALEEVRSETTKLGIVPLRAAAEELLRYSA
ncbi:MAG TPA: hypothetical protein VFN67_16980 [Polyangiales bacterium]|nr:hypothetical protein [Polyangiales bacterium]